MSSARSGPDNVHDWLARPLGYFPCIGGWTLALWQLAQWWSTGSLSAASWLDALGGAGAAWVIGTLVGVVALLVNEAAYAQLLRVRRWLRGQSS